MSDINKYSKVRRYKYGINALILTISVIGIVFIINAILPRYSKQYDLTENNKFTLTPQTLKILKNLKKEVTIHLFSKEGDPQNEMMNDLLKQYARKSEFIKIKNIDVDKDPSLANQYKVTQYGTVVFECEKMKSQVGQKELFDFGFGMMGHGESPKFNGEVVVTDNIMKVTSQKKKNIYFIIGHNEHLVSNMEEGGLSKVQDYLIRENYEVKSINLTTEPELPVENTVLVIPGPKLQLLDRELKAIDSYLKKGGKVFIMLDPNVAASEGLYKLLIKWGVKIDSDIIIDPELSYFYDPLTPIPIFISHNITNELLDAKISAVFPTARTVSKLDTASDSLEVWPLLRTSERSWAEKDFENKKTVFEKNDVKGPLTMAVAVEAKNKKIDSPDTTVSDDENLGYIPPRAKLVVIGDSDFATNRMTNSVGNVDLFMNSVNWLVGDTEKVSIRPLIMDFKKINLTKSQSKIVLIICLAFVPLLVAGIGGVIWWKRRSL
ncbi:MAG: GldG family protein [bacterium]|nr:GldG family protein [bacterium]